MCYYILSISVASHDPGFKINAPVKPNVLACYQIDSVCISRGLSPSLESVPSLLFVPPDDPRHCPEFGSVFAGLSCFCSQVMSAQILALPYLKAQLSTRTVNARSMRDKAAVLSDLVVSQRIDLLGITKTWLTARETSADLPEVTPPGFSFFQIPRAKRRGGGVGLFVSSAYKFIPIILPAHTSFKSISGNSELGQSCLNILNIYPQPGPTSTFLGEF